MDSIKKLIDSIDSLPRIVKIILAIPALDLVWTLYRLLRSIVAGNVVGIVIAAIIFLCAPFFWVIDLLCIVFKGRIWSID